MTNSFLTQGWTARFFLWAMAILMALTPLLVPGRAFAAMSSTFVFVSSAANVVPNQVVRLLDFAMAESDGGATLNSMKLKVTGVFSLTDIAYVFMIQDTNNPSADVFDASAGDAYWRWTLTSASDVVTYALATDLDIDGVGADTTSTPGVAALPTAMTGRGTYEFTLGVAVASNPTNAQTFRLERETGATGEFASTTTNLQTGVLQQSAIMTIINDTTPPTITGGGPGNGQQFVPDQAYINAVASEPLASASVNTTNVTLHSCTGATDASSCATPVTTTNLCTSVSLSSTEIVCNHAALTASTTYRLQIGTGVTDSSSNALAAAVTRIFRTGSVVAGTNTTLPRVMSSTPSPSAAFPVNANITLTFPLGPEGNMNFNTGAGSTAAVGDLNYCTNGECAFSLKEMTNLSFGAENCTNTTTCAPSWNSTSRQLTINPATNLNASSGYEMCLRGGMHALAVKNSASQTLPSDSCVRFSTVAADSAAPTLAVASPVSPTNNATNVSMFSSVKVKFSESLDPSTLSLSTVRLCADTTSGTAGCETSDTRSTDVAKFGFSYDSFDKSVRLDPLAADSRSTSTKYCIEVVGGSSGVKDLAGNAFSATSSANCFTMASSTTDTVSGSPKVLFADGDNFKVVVKFNEGMRSAGLVTSGTVNTSNVALACPTGVTVPLSGKTGTYNSETFELSMEGLGLPTSQTCQVTITNASDLAGNAIDTSSSNNVGSFTVQNASTTGGFLGAGAPASDDFFGGTSGQTAATFWERPQRAEPRNKQTNKSGKVEVEFPAPGAMAVGSKIILTFPAGFNVASASLPATNVSFSNADINGRESGSPTLTAAVSGQAVTLTTVGAAIAANQMIEFELDNVTTPTEAAENLRIPIIVKDSSGVKLGQTINPAPFDINAGGSLSISGTVCKGTTSGGSCSGSDTAIASLKVFCAQMGGFEVSGTAGAFVGHQETTTNASGVFSITGLTSGQYNCGIPPDPTKLADTGGIPPFQSVTLSSANKTGLDFKFKNLSGSAGKTLTMSITGGPASETLDVFCSAGATDFQFSAPTMKSLTLNASGVGSTTLKLQQDKSYECGVGPHIAFENFSSGGPPPVPTFTFMPPKPQKVTMSADATLTFALTSTNRTITGTVVDGSSNGIANVFVHAAPAGCFDATSGEVKDCFGAFAQTKTDGTFTLNVSDGVYEVGADGPGLPPSTTELANVKGANVTGVTLKMVKSSTTISGAVQDESGNGIKYAHVSADRRVLVTGSDACDFTNSRPAGGFADSPTDSSGNFTIYAAAGTWCLRAFSPAYGEVGTKTVIVTTSSLTGQNIAATAANFGTVSGTVTKAGTAVSGAFVNCFGTTGGNHAQTGSDGTYSMKVKLATSGTTTMQCDAFAPGVGPMGRATVTIASGSTTATQDFTQAGESGTITVTATGLTEGFCDARDSSGLSSGAPIQSGTSTIKAPAGTYTMRCGTKNTGPLTLTPTSVTLTAGGTAAVTATVPTLRTVSGRVTDGTNNLEGAKVVFTETTTKASFVVTSGNQSGTNNNLSATNVPEGIYNILASKKGYLTATSTVTVSGGNVTLSSVMALTQATGSAGVTVTFPIQADGAAYTGEAKVICSSSAGTVLVGDNDKTTSTAAVALTNDAWSCKAYGDNGKHSTSSSVTVTGGALVGTAPTLSLDTTITGFTSKSDSGTLALSSGGNLNFNDIDSGLKLNIPSGALSTTDSSTGSVTAETDPLAAAVDPGTDANFVGKKAYKFTPKDSGGNNISDTNSSVTLEIPYTDAEIADAGVDETKLKIALYDDTNGTWESMSTTADTTNNTLTAQIDHFSTYGVIGGTTSTTTSSGSTGTTSSGGGGGGGGGGSTPTTSTPTTVPSTPTTATPSTPAATSTDSTTSAPATSAAPAAAPAAAPKVPDVLIKNPTDVSAVLETLGLTRNTADEAKYRPLLKSDASNFKVSLSAEQENALTNFVAYGISQATVKLGSGERRAVLRDYLDTVGRADVKFSDVERITKGEKPIFRNLKKEQAQVTEAVKLFEKIEGHRPNFKDAKEDLLWNTLMYRIRFTRDLEKEKKAIGQFRAKFKRLPSTPMDWAAVRGIGYVVNE